MDACCTDGPLTKALTSRSSRCRAYEAVTEMKSLGCSQTRRWWKESKKAFGERRTLLPPRYATPPATMNKSSSASALRRLMTEYKQLTEGGSPDGMFTAGAQDLNRLALRSCLIARPGPVSESDFFTWEALISGPKDTPFVRWDHTRSPVGACSHDRRAGGRRFCRQTHLRTFYSPTMRMITHDNSISRLTTRYRRSR